QMQPPWPGSQIGPVLSPVVVSSPVVVVLSAAAVEEPVGASPVVVVVPAEVSVVVGAPWPELAPLLEVGSKVTAEVRSVSSSSMPSLQPASASAAHTSGASDDEVAEAGAGEEARR